MTPRGHRGNGYTTCQSDLVWCVSTVFKQKRLKGIPAACYSAILTNFCAAKPTCKGILSPHSNAQNLSSTPAEVSLPKQAPCHLYCIHLKAKVPSDTRIWRNHCKQISQQNWAPVKLHRDKLSPFQKQSVNMYKREQNPAETTTCHSVTSFSSSLQRPGLSFTFRSMKSPLRAD